MGCFWGAEKGFWELPDGIHTTAVGYAGGYTPNPTYEEVCSAKTGHNEVVLVVFRPEEIAYEELLKTFGKGTTRPRGCARATTSARSTARAYTRTPRRSGKPRRRHGTPTSSG